MSCRQLSCCNPRGCVVILQAAPAQPEAMIADLSTRRPGRHGVLIYDYGYAQSQDRADVFSVGG